MATVNETASTYEKCRHFCGIQNVCGAGIDPRSVRDASRPGPYRWPCFQLIGRAPASDTCAKREWMTAEEHLAHDAEVKAAVERAMDAQAAGKCHMCGDPIGNCAAHLSWFTEGDLMSVIPVGMHKAIPAGDYHRRELGVVSNSALKLVNRSPAHYKAWIDGAAEEKDSPALAFGRIFHCALLEPDVFRARYIAMPKFGDLRKAENKAAKAAWEAEHAGADPITFDDMLTITGMVESVRRHPLASKMIQDGEAELTLSWTDEETGLSCKSRLDYYVQGLAMIADVKTCEDASWDAFRRDVAKYSYHRQDALYRSAALELDLPVHHFVLLAVEKSPPYAVATYTLDGDGIGRGYQAARRDMNVLAECMRTGSFPAYPETIMEIEVPPWA